MTQTVRFVDTVSYTEADQSDFNMRMMRPQGVIPESALGLLAGSAIGSMAVRVGPGEAFVQGFQYKNDANLDLTISANISGSTRIDIVVLALNRASNTLSLAVVTGVPGAGAPALTQVAGGNWQFPLYTITVPNGAGSITSGNIADARVYSRWPISALATPMTTADDIIVGGAGGVPGRMAKGGVSQVFGVNAAGVLGYYPVTSDMITDRGIVGSDIAVGTITTTEIADRGIAGGDLAVGAVTTTEIADRGILGGDLAVGTVTTTEIADGTIVGGDIAPQSIHGGAYGAGSRIIPASINSQDIQDGGIAGADIGNSQISSAHVIDRTLVASDIALNTITSAELAAGATSFMAQGSSAAAFAGTGINNWVHDTANLVVTVTLPVAGWVFMTFQGSFYVSGANGSAAFGLSRLGTDASPPQYVITTFQSVNEVRNIFVQRAESLPAGSYSYTLGMTSSSPGVTVNAWNSPRYMIGQGFFR